MKLARLFLALPLMLAPMTGCKLITAAPTPGVPQFYSQAALVLNDFSGVLLQSQNLFTNAHASGLVSATDYQNGMKVFSAIATQGNNIDSLIQSEASQTSITAAISALIQQVGSMPSAFGIKDANTQAGFQALCTSMQTILQATSALVQTPTTVVTTPVP